MIFKHLPGTYNREDMSELIDEFGPLGYGVMWIVFEIIAGQAKNEGLFEATYPAKRWAQHCGVSMNKFKKILKALVKLKVFRQCETVKNKSVLLTIKHIYPSKIISIQTANNRGSTEYKEWRQAVFSRDRFTCQSCGKVGIDGNGIDAHHIQPYASHPDLRTVADNGLTLCTKCHQKTHGHI